MIKRTIYTLAVILISTAAQTIYGQNLDTVKISNKLPVLNGKAFFTFPAHAKDVQRGTGIMAADPNANEETRIILDIGDMRLVFFAEELFALGDNNLLSAISKQNENDGSKTLTNKDSLLSALTTPVQFDSSKDAILVNSLLVKTQDNTLFRINAYINPKAFKLRSQFQKLAEKVFATLSKGNRMNNRNAREEKYRIFGSDKNFIFSLPAGYSVTVDQKYDFQVFKFHKYQALADTDWIQLIIYDGDYPSPVYKDFNLTEKDAKKIKGKFISRDIDWLYFNITDRGIFDKEQLIPFDDIEKGMIVHIAMLSNREALIEELSAIVEKARLN